jgi:hypothetical protein
LPRNSARTNAYEAHQQRTQLHKNFKHILRSTKIANNNIPVFQLLLLLFQIPPPPPSSDDARDNRSPDRVRGWTTKFRIY